MKRPRRPWLLLSTVTSLAGSLGLPGLAHSAPPSGGRGFAAACPANDAGATRGAECLGCHDGAIAPDVDLPTPGASPKGLHAPHPVGVRYSDAVARDPMGYAPEWEVRRTLALPAGHVECGSCHVGRVDAGRSVRLAHDGDRLCTTCHRK